MKYSSRQASQDTDMPFAVGRLDGGARYLNVFPLHSKVSPLSVHRNRGWIHHATSGRANWCCTHRSFLPCVGDLKQTNLPIRCYQVVFRLLVQTQRGIRCSPSASRVPQVRPTDSYAGHLLRCLANPSPRRHHPMNNRTWIPMQGPQSFGPQILCLVAIFPCILVGCVSSSRTGSTPSTSPSAHARLKEAHNTPNSPESHLCILPGTVSSR